MKRIATIIVVVIALTIAFASSASAMKLNLSKSQIQKVQKYQKTGKVETGKAFINRVEVKKTEATRFHSPKRINRDAQPFKTNGKFQNRKRFSADSYKTRMLNRN